MSSLIRGLYTTIRSLLTSQYLLEFGSLVVSNLIYNTSIDSANKSLYLYLSFYTSLTLLAAMCITY